MTTNTRRMLDVALTAIGVSLLPGILSAEIDGHGPDAWRVTGVAADDVLNARMGPGTGYPVIETFAHDARGLEEIACVPFFTMAHYSAMTEAEIEALPARWCLVRSADMSKAGWVAQRYLIAEGYEKVETPAADTDEAPGDAMIREAISDLRDIINSSAGAPRTAEDMLAELRRETADRHILDHALA